ISVLADQMPAEPPERRASRLSAIEALGQSGAPQAEPVLIGLLEWTDIGVQKAAAAALGQLGTARAVKVLEKLARGFWVDRRLKHEARAAIQRIEVRLGGSAAGRLSIAADASGALSLEQRRPGSLSLAEAPVPEATPPES